MQSSWHPHDDVIKWKHFPRNWPFVRGIHRFPVNSPHKGQWRGALMFSLICARINGWVNNGGAGDLRRYRAHYDVIVMHVVAGIDWWRINGCYSLTLLPNPHPLPPHPPPTTHPPPLNGPLRGTIISEILIKIQTFSFTKIHLQLSFIYIYIYIIMQYNIPHHTIHDWPCASKATLNDMGKYASQIYQVLQI